MTVAEVRHLFTYTEWANARVLSAAEKLPPEELLRDVHISHKSILGTLLHVAGADWIWLERWHGNSPVGHDVWAGWTPNDARSLQQVREQWQPVIRRRNAYLDEISDADLSRELGYTRFTGEAYSLPLVQQMQHVVNHATLHRGQIVGMIRQLGIAPPPTDLLFYLMETRKPSGKGLSSLRARFTATKSVSKLDPIRTARSITPGTLAGIYRKVSAHERLVHHELRRHRLLLAQQLDPQKR